MVNFGTRTDMAKIVIDELEKLGIPFTVTSGYSYPYSAVKQAVRKNCRISLADGRKFYSLVGIRTTVRWWVNKYYKEEKNESKLLR